MQPTTVAYLPGTYLLLGKELYQMSGSVTQMTCPEIEPGTTRLRAECTNQCIIYRIRPTQADFKMHYYFKSKICATFISTNICSAL